MSSKQIKFEKWVDPISHEGTTGPVIVGPMGIISLSEGVNLEEIYNFYIMHTNFDITYDIKDKLEKLDGIESLDVFTRYRARIGIGLAFNEHRVFRSVEDLLITEEEPKFNLEEKRIDSIKKLMTKKYWFIYLNKENQLLFEMDNDLEKLKTTFESLKDNIERSEQSW